jgi:hypothetical protein
MTLEGTLIDSPHFQKAPPPTPIASYQKTKQPIRVYPPKYLFNGLRSLKKKEHRFYILNKLKYFHQKKFRISLTNQISVTQPISMLGKCSLHQSWLQQIDC